MGGHGDDDDNDNAFTVSQKHRLQNILGPSMSFALFLVFFLPIARENEIRVLLDSACIDLHFNK